MSIVKPFTFTAGTKARANEVNDNFDILYSQVNSNITAIENNAEDIDSLSLSKANVNGNSTQRFAVGDPVTNSDAINKGYLLRNGLPTGFVVYCAIEEVPDGYLICDGSEVSRTTYSDLFNVIGTIFGSGDGSTTFAIPDLLDKFIQGDTVVGTSKAAGLPNITGNTGYGGHEVGTMSGAFYSGGGSTVWGPNSYEYETHTAYFDASRSSSIYGRSSTVQPPALTLLPIIKY